jgi:hypothetical protein
LKTLPYDPAEFLDDETAMADYLRLTCEDGSPAEIARALGAIARARHDRNRGQDWHYAPRALQGAERRGKSRTRNRRRSGGSPRLPPYVRTPSKAARRRRGVKALSGR